MKWNRSHPRILARRAAAALSTLLIPIALVAAPVDAKAASVQHRIDRSGFAIAVWDEEGTGTFAVAEVFPDQDEEILILVTETRDSLGRVIGTTTLVADANIAPYGTFTLNPKLASAKLDVTAVPASCYTTGQAPECTTSTISAHITWTGVGKLSHSIVRFHDVYHEDGIVLVNDYRSSGLSRDAVAAGTMNATTLTTEDITRALLARDVSGEVMVCVADFC